MASTQEFRRNPEDSTLLGSVVTGCFEPFAVPGNIQAGLLQHLHIEKYQGVERAAAEAM